LLGRNGATQDLEVQNDSANEDIETDDDAPHRPSHRKSFGEISEWVDHAESGANLGLDSEGRSEMPEYHEEILQDYKVFVKSSESYRWLVSKFQQHGRLSFGDRDIKSGIGFSLREKLRTQESLRKMSHRRPLSKVQVEFILQWHPETCVEDEGHEQDYSSLRTLDDILCLTGSWPEAQAMTVAKYMRQTWPSTGEAVINLFEQLMTISGNETCVCEYR
jgi:hypothetical protein